MYLHSEETFQNDLLAYEKLQFMKWLFYCFVNSFIKKNSSTEKMLEPLLCYFPRGGWGGADELKREFHDPSNEVQEFIEL